jgi:hypothetical protein
VELARVAVLEQALAPVVARAVVVPEAAVVLEAAEVALAAAVEVAPAAAEVVPAAAGRAGKGRLDGMHCNPGARFHVASVVRGLEHVARESS